MLKVSRETSVYAMSAQNAPVLHVNAGTQLQFETWDALQGQFNSDGSDFDEFDWNRVNPATGPVYVNDAQPGDILSVKIEKIDVADEGVVLCGAGMGVMGSVMQGTFRKIVRIEGDVAHFSDKIKLPLNKMVGVIGVAPKSGEIKCGVPDMHGGNMDCKEICEGATVFLPVNVPGALLAMGDLHAVMADGEIGVTGVEVAGLVTVTVDVIKGKNWPLPMIMNDEYVMALHSHEDLDIAADTAVANIIEYLTTEEGMAQGDAVMLTSLVGDVRICQIVDPKKTVRVEFPKKYL